MRKTVTVQHILKWVEKRGFRFEARISEPDVKVTGFSSVYQYRQGTVTWVKKQESVQHVEEAALVILQNGVEADYKNQICTEQSKEMFFSLLQVFWGEQPMREIAADAVVLTEHMGEDVSIGHHCYIDAQAQIGSHVTIEHNVVICAPCTIEAGTHIGSGTVIGTDGFGYYDMEDGTYGKVPHFGGVRIGKNVEIGANTCIDRGTIDDTVIGDGVKIDNLCHIGHNVVIEKNAMVIAQSMLGGSCHLAEHTYIAPGVLVMNQACMEKNSMAGLGAVVTKNVAENAVVVGVPANYLRDRR